MIEILKLLRVKQYVKNLFIFLPIFFGMKFFEFDLLMNNFIAFFSFCFLASSIYILNDILDRDIDKKHPKKKNRPIASGKISVKKAILILSILLVISFLIASLIVSPELYILLTSYLILNILYVFWIKHIGIIDVFVVASGYVIRILVGGVTADIDILHWIIIMTFLLALFLGFAKRRDDVLIMKETGQIMRKSIDGYTLQFMDSILFITSAITLVAYIMYTIAEDTTQRYGSENIYLTSIFVLLGIMRYLQITISLKKSGSPTEILYKDKMIQFSIIAWVLSFAAIMYF